MKKSDKSPAIAIGALLPHHAQQWRGLWQQYLAFYNAHVAESVTALTWSRVLGNGNVVGLAAACGNELIGFGIVVIHEATWSDRHSAYLEDLFVRPDVRGRGVGRNIIDALIQRAQAGEWGALYWHTRESNAVARRLYDSYCPADDFVRYRLTF